MYKVSKQLVDIVKFMVHNEVRQVKESEREYDIRSSRELEYDISC